MLTGRGAFARETMSDTLAAILEREPDWNTLPPSTPQIVTRLLQRCVEKEPRRRLRDIADARLEIEHDVSGSARPAAEQSPVAGVARSSRSLWIPAVASGLRSRRRRWMAGAIPAPAGANRRRAD
jgi:hypothetical protein